MALPTFAEHRDSRSLSHLSQKQFLSLFSTNTLLQDPKMTSKMKARLKSKFSPLLKPLREPFQTFMIFLSFVMLYFVGIGFLSYFNDDPQAFKSDRPFLISGRDEVSSDKKLSTWKGFDFQISLLSISRLKLILQLILCPQQLQRLNRLRMELNLSPIG